MQALSKATLISVFLCFSQACAIIGYKSSTVSYALGSPKANKPRPPIPEDSMEDITTWVIVGTAVALIGYDVYVATAQAKDDRSTISQVIWRKSKRNPVIPFLFGALMGHLFWPQ